MNPFSSYRDSVLLKDQIKCKYISVGEYSYYSGYYHGRPFEECVMYLDEWDNERDENEIDKLIIGKFCSIATGVKIMMGGTQGHNFNWIASYPLDHFDDDFDGYQQVPPKAHQLKGDTIIGNDVWLGAECLILPGIHIADGAVIGARAVVTKNVGPYEVWVGNPARPIKKRFLEEDIQKLLQLQWWNWELPVLKRNLAHLRSNDVSGLWKKHLSNEL